MFIKNSGLRFTVDNSKLNFPRDRTTVTPYVDDITIAYQVWQTPSVTKRVQIDANRLAKWKIRINADKSEVLLIQGHRRYRSEQYIIILGHRLLRRGDVPIFGVIIMILEAVSRNHTSHSSKDQPIPSHRGKKWIDLLSKFTLIILIFTQALVMETLSKLFQH